MTEKIQYIPARLKNAAVGGHVAGVDDLVDDVTGKTQQEINAEVSEEISDIKDGSTESIADLRQAIDGEEARAEGAEGGLNTRLQTVEQLASISVGGGDIGIATASDFTNRTTAGDAKVPTVSALLNGTGDGVWDISGHNNGATYADIAAALGTNGVNIPDSIRKGGMSVKFIQTSDNKYVQYRLMSDTFSTIEIDWQGVDDEPTAGSDNLVKSGGVKKVVDGNVVVELTEQNTTQHKYITTSGIEGGSNAYFYSNPIHLNAGDKIEIRDVCDGVAAISLSDETIDFPLTPVVTAPSSATSVATYSYIAEADCYVVVSGKWAALEFCMITLRDSINGRLSYLETSVSDIEDIIPSNLSKSLHSFGVVITADNYTSYLTDLDNAEANTIIVVATGLQNISNTISDFGNGATIVTFYPWKTSDSTGALQLVIPSGGSQIYFRNRWASWYSWQTIPRNADVQNLIANLTETQALVNTINNEVNGAARDISLTTDNTTQHKYINTGGTEGGANAYFYSNPIYLNKGERIDFRCVCDGVAVFSKSAATMAFPLTPVLTTTAQDTQLTTYSYTANENCYIVVSGKWANLEFCRVVLVEDSIVGELNKVNLQLASIGCAFSKVLFIGDSLTQGAYFGTPYISKIGKNFPNMFCRRGNVAGANQGYSGIDAMGWYAEKALASYTDYDLVVLWLGTNNGYTDTMATDVTPYDDYHDYANTNTGCICKIIESIKESNPSVNIVMLNCFATSGDSLTVTNKVIGEVAEKYDLPLFDTSWMSLANNPTYSYHAGVNNPHLGIYGAFVIANKLWEYLNDYFTTNWIKLENGVQAEINPADWTYINR